VTRRPINGPVATPLGGGLTVVSGVPARPDLKKSHDFEVGDRVRAKDRPQLTGTVASLPRGPVIQLGGHTLGNEMGVDLDVGGRSVGDVDHWEKVT
jgi:hypothetical protein